ncbi:hypothetical protein FACS189494_04160 [Spirochaetia bacterium]|nr:hypothetical protein FACS189494_04160 [Spirochaetia bacterium]
MKKFLLLGRVLPVIAMAILTGCSQPADEIDALDEDSGKLPALTGSVSITGEKAVGGKLTAKTSALGGSGAIAYKWTSSLDNNAVIGTSPTYMVAEADNNSIIRVTVSRAGYLGTKNAYATIGTVEPTPVVTHAPDEPWIVGEQGPAGGTIFFVNDDHGRYGDDWDYLEAAPEDVPGLFAWASDAFTSVRLEGDFSVDIGKGQKNTELILDDERGDPNPPAAKAATGYKLNGFTDWFLPSSGELNAMYENRAVISGDFADSFYWSSSQNQDAINNDEAWYQKFDNGDIYYYGNKYGTHYVRPVRAFLASPEPTPTPTATPSGSPTASASPTAAPSGTPPASPEPSPTPSSTPSGTPTSTPTASATPEPTSTSTPEPTTSATPTATPSGTPTASATPTATSSGTPTSTPMPNPSSPSIAVKFGIDVTVNSTDKVATVFTTLHNYLATDPQVSGSGTTRKIGDIALGDYIDLASLNVAAYNGQGAINATDAAITPNPQPFEGYEGRLLRLIVVGINTYSNKNDNGTGNDPHLVFQFQNIPGDHRMNYVNTNVGGYKDSEMRAYLTGNFLTGLKNAGVPEDIFWAPSRRVWNGFLQEEWRPNNTDQATGSSNTTVDEIEDALFLPTEREMFGTRIYSHANYETAVNQGRFEYYLNNPSRIKYHSGLTDKRYWVASPHYGKWCYFEFVSTDGSVYFNDASRSLGVAPAFCVK